MEVVVDWDGTVTEVDSLHLVLEEFGDTGIYDAAEKRARTQAHPARGDLPRVRDGSGSSRGRRPLGARERRRTKGLRRLRSPAPPARRLERLSRADRAGAGARGNPGRAARQSPGCPQRRLARPLPQRRALLRVRRAVQAPRRGRARPLRLRRRRLSPIAASRSPRAACSPGTASPGTSTGSATPSRGSPISSISRSGWTAERADRPDRNLLSTNRVGLRASHRPVELS